MDRLRTRFNLDRPRPATHISDLLFCLRKAWGKRHIDQADWTDRGEIDDDTFLTFAGGLLFEDLVSTGERQRPLTYCFKCRAVGQLQGEELPNCPVCGERWIVGTPDYEDGGILHEVKQTRKSRRKGPEEAPWWIEQLASYVAMKRKGGLRVEGTAPNWSRLVVNWLMGDYGSRKKGLRPVPPRAALDPFKVRFEPDFEDGWLEELGRRKGIYEGEEMPALTGMGEGDERSPAYPWECPSCPVGLALQCEMYKWNAEGVEIIHGQEEEEEGEREGSQGSQGGVTVWAEGEAGGSEKEEVDGSG